MHESLLIEVEVCLLCAAEGWFLLFIQSVSLCLFIGEMSPFLLMVINDQ